ncbi:MAG: hypothetical protein IJC56_12005 [Clostridia bacterium]|nr:hypothetical protein [Clostridia bacterium]
MRMREFFCKHRKSIIKIIVAVVPTVIYAKSKISNKNVIKQSVPNAQPAPVVMFHGVPLSELSELAKEIYHGISCAIDKSGFLIYKFRTNSGKTCDSVQITLDETGVLKNLGRRYPGQIWSSADAFIKKANEVFKFTK